MKSERSITRPSVIGRFRHRVGPAAIKSIVRLFYRRLRSASLIVGQPCVSSFTAFYDRALGTQTCVYIVPLLSDTGSIRESESWLVEIFEINDREGIHRAFTRWGLPM